MSKQEQIEKAFEILEDAKQAIEDVKQALTEELITTDDEESGKLKQLFCIDSIWKYGGMGIVEVLSYVDTEGCFRDYNDKIWEINSPLWQLIDTGKIAMADQLPPEGVPFIGYWNEGFNDFKIKNGEWFNRELGTWGINMHDAYSKKNPHVSSITHWRISGAFADIAMDILRR